MNLQALLTENQAIKAENAQLKFRLEQLERLLFGSKTERFVGAEPSMEQLNLFVDPTEEQQAVAETVEQTITYKKQQAAQKSHPGRTPIPDHFPVEQIVIEPEEDVEGLVKIGEQRTEYVEYTPASLVKKVIIRPKYAKPKANGQTKVLIAALPSRPIDKGVAGPGLLAHLITAKFVDHLPFYRQIQRFQRDYDWTIPKSTINSWFSGSCDLLTPLYQQLVGQALQTDYLQADESRIKVLTTIRKDKNGKLIKKPDKATKSKQQLGWMWVVHNPINGLVVFNYEDARSAEAANGLLAEYTQGYLQTDGYDSYNHIAARPQVQRLGCLAHVRRKFFDAQTNDPQRAEHALKTFKAIYEHEKKVKELNPDQRKTYRLKHLAPIYQRFKDWMDQQAVFITPKSPIGQAFNYAQNQWPHLCTLFADGRLLIDNNLIENKIRPLALGRKNYLFAGSHQAAQRIAMIYSFMATCQIHNVNPFDWFCDTLQRLPDTKRSKLHTLLPGYSPHGDRLDV